MEEKDIINGELLSAEGSTGAASGGVSPEPSEASAPAGDQKGLENVTPVLSSDRTDNAIPTIRQIVGKSTGGPDYHKDNCRCNACRSRRRAKEAGFGSVGEWKNSTYTKVPKVLSKSVTPTGLDIQVEADWLPTSNKKDLQVRTLVYKWLEARAIHPDMSNKGLADKIGVTYRQLNYALNKATKEGWLTFTDALDRIEYEIIPQTIQNLKDYLQAGDKKVTIETAKGTIFPAYQAAKGVLSQPQTVLALKIENPPGGDLKVATGVIVGVPKDQVEI